MPFTYVSRREMRRLSTRHRNTSFLVACGVFVVVISLVYLLFDFDVNREYVDTTQLAYAINSKEQYYNLITKLDRGVPTGINGYDDSTVTYGKRIDITPGVGEFRNLLPSYTTYVKSTTHFNTWKYSHSSSIVARYLSNPYFLNHCTVYKPSGVVKLYDRYVFIAVGQCWHDMFEHDGNQTGKLYRVYLDTGACFDAIVVDTKGAGDTIKTPGGVTIGHDKGYNEVCLTEFYLVDFYLDGTTQETWNLNHARPVENDTEGKYSPQCGIDYATCLTVKDDPYPTMNNAKMKLYSANDVPDYHGNVIAFEEITDTRVDALDEESYRAYEQVKLLEHHAVNGVTPNDYILKGDK